MGKENYHKVFVYGTLMKGYDGFNKFMSNAEFVANGDIQGSLYLSNSGYPVAILDNSENKISGEIYKISEKTLNEIRRYEGTETALTYFTEKIIKVKTENGYLYAHAFVAHKFFIPIIKLMCKNISSVGWEEYNKSRPFFIKYKRKIIFTVLLLINLFMILEFIINKH
ncbi:conserved hypothetical protein [Deferribacter desulfuricans SSM1]|uniref:Gamma-glutamylcyclotransferase AIG2-like domain-containing protein n=1 Tax=Deferribacter desulfuricans (strain DSM 14783 / JCM 11476 / NBRC 101012 / SSM1) TaxID=639282 RepID=D3P956_DEFDS|nr:gamma-glutamylcyclotransferase family protein [Deferribacter desulfuricans]BAI81246.1 conserved hypothetical protein [Deferribacter desulfuricans SSM1]